MKAFHTIAVPHKDILQGKLTMDVFAADLWEVNQKRGPDEYKNSGNFFAKTYLTEGLSNLISIVEKRLKGKGGDPVIQIQTPFGGGKTHSLIAFYHKAEEWKAKKIVIVGTSLSPEDTLWGIIEKQLTGTITKLTGKVSPGKELLRELLSKYSPLLILMDEVLEYVTKAAGIIVGGNNLAAQTIAFFQELTEVASTLENVCILVTLPSSITEHYDQNAEKLFQQLQKAAGRVEKIYTPVQDYEINKIIRKRLFSEVNETEIKNIITMFIDYAEKEKILPPELELSEYKNRFLDSYPFLPDVIDILYHRWGSYPTFQRTRGVLRLLSLIIYSLKESDKPYISLADFNLENQEIRQELLKHIGSEFNSVVSADITDKTSGSKKVDVSLGDAYRGLAIGTRASTVIFMHSFSGGQEHGASMQQIKRAATTVGNPTSVVAEALEQLRSKLFYLQTPEDKYFFSNQPNLNRILLTKIENIKAEKVISLEKELLKGNIIGHYLKVFPWEENSSNINDSEDLKLVILNREDKNLIENIFKTKGQSPRVNRNTLIFLYPIESERSVFINNLKRKIAYDYIQQDNELKLSTEQKKEIEKEIKTINSDLKEFVRKFYRMIELPDKSGLKEIDLGIPTYGENKPIDQEIFEKLKADGEILEKIAPIVINEKYLSDKDYILTEQLYQSSFKTPGEPRITNRAVFEQSLIEGIEKGLFGLGELKKEGLVCLYYKETPSTIAFIGDEIIIKDDVCRKQKEAQKVEGKEGAIEKEPQISDAGVTFTGDTGISIVKENVLNKIHIKFQIPKGKVANVMGILNYLQSRYENIKIEVSAIEGSISNQEYEDKIEEALRQSGIELDED
jgi:hypothetical protein